MKETTAAITTFITTYHRSELLGKAVKSVLKQTYPHWKLCVYDNGSDDETKVLMTKFQKQDSRISYHRHATNIGMMRNYEYAFSQINTPYFSFLSDDDFLLPWFYETSLNGFMMHSEAAFVVCGVLMMNAQKQIVRDPLRNWKKTGYFAKAEGVFEMTNNQFPIPNGVVFKKDILKETLPCFDEDIKPLWDAEYLLQLSARYPFYMIPKPCAVYLVHEEGFINSFFNSALNSSKLLEVYFRSVDKLINRLSMLSDRNGDLKTVIKNSFIKFQTGVSAENLTYYFAKRKFKEGRQLLKLFTKYFGIMRTFHLFFKAAVNILIFTKINKIRNLLSRKLSILKKREIKVTDYSDCSKIEPIIEEYLNP